MTSFFSRNLKTLKTQAAAVASLSRELSPHITPLNAASGDVTARWDKILLHSAYDPVKEARAFSKHIPPGSRVCLYGFGLGHHIGPLLERIGPDGSLVVIELNPELLSAALILRDLTDLFHHPSFQLVFGTSEAGVSRQLSLHLAEWQADASEPPEVLFHTPSYQCLPPGFPAIANALEILRMERRFPAILGGLERENFAHNRELAERTPGIDALKGRHKDRPALLVGAGPSLDDLLPHLHRIGKETIVGCVDTALPACIRAGRVPDYVFTLDPQEESFHYFANHLAVPFTLIFTPTAHTRILHHHIGEKYVVYKEGHSLYKESLAEMQTKGTTQAGGSVSCLGLDCLLRMGAAPILLLGQDLAHSGGRVYAAGSDNNRRMLDAVHQPRPLSGEHLEKRKKDTQVAVPGTFGQTIKTHRNLLSYKRTLEQLAGRHPEVKILNLCSHGARIEGADFIGSPGELKRFLPRLAGGV